jgi:hypothetical protein
MLSSQQIFTKSATHLLKQGKQAMKGNDARYRIGENVGCALFPFTKVGYNKGRKIEGENVKSAAVQSVLWQNGVNMERDMDLIEDLQNIHDHYSPIMWPDMLAATAKKFDLKMVKAKLKDTSVQVSK